MSYIDFKKSSRQFKTHAPAPKREEREWLNIEAKMRASNIARQSIYIQNISASGFQAKAMAAPKLGQLVKITFADGQEVDCDVCWVWNRVFGVRAKTPIRLKSILRAAEG